MRATRRYTILGHTLLARLSSLLFLIHHLSPYILSLSSKSADKQRWEEVGGDGTAAPSVASATAAASSRMRLEAGDVCDCRLNLLKYAYAH
jgi:hypothetical protein